MNTVYMTYMQRKNNQNITKKVAVIMTNNIILKYICSFFLLLYIYSTFDQLYLINSSQ